MKRLLPVLLFVSVLSADQAAPRAEVVRMLRLYEEIGGMPLKCVPSGDPELREIAERFSNMHRASTEYQRSRLAALGTSAEVAQLRRAGLGWHALGFEVVVPPGVVPKGWQSDVAAAEKAYSGYLLEHEHAAQRWIALLERDAQCHSLVQGPETEFIQLCRRWVPGYNDDRDE